MNLPTLGESGRFAGDIQSGRFCNYKITKWLFTKLISGIHPAPWEESTKHVESDAPSIMVPLLLPQTLNPGASGRARRP